MKEIKPVPDLAKMGTIVMDFPVALRHVIEGRRITKLEWKDSSVFLHLSEGFLLIHKADGTNTRLLLSDGDLLGKDWTVLQDTPGH